MNSIETDRLTKVYPRGGGCREITLQIAPGQVFGLLGPNGAGKSTLVKTLLGLLRPTSGTARLLGRPPGNLEARRRVGFLPEAFRYQEWLSGEELLQYHADLRGMDPKAAHKRIGEVLATVNMTGRERQRIQTYSKGMQQRIGLAAALISDPDLLFLDEPTSALDPVGRKEVREIIIGLREAGKTVFLNSHLLSEVETVCDEVAIISGGYAIAHGKLKDLVGDSAEVELVCGSFPTEVIERLKQVAERVEIRGDHALLKLRDINDTPEVAKAVVEAGERIYRLNPKTVSLEDLFVSLVQGGDR